MYTEISKNSNSIGQRNTFNKKLINVTWYLSCFHYCLLRQKWKMYNDIGHDLDSKVSTSVLYLTKRQAYLGRVWPSAAARGISEQLWHAHSEFGGCSECSARGGNWELFLSSCQTLRLPVQTALQPAAKEVWAWLSSNFPGVVNNIMSLLQPK